MLKLFKNKQIFFILSFAAIFAAGFFIYPAFSDFSENFASQVLGQANQIGLKLFTASVLPPDENLNKIENDSQPLTTSDENKSDENNNSAVAPGESLQDQLDDIQEKLDIISQQVQEFIAEQNIEEHLADAEKAPDGKIDQDRQNDKNDIKNNVQVHPKILISEIQILPAEQRFVELYNPNPADVDLTNWYLQRKTAGGSEYSSFLTKNDFLGKIIPANGYFIISKFLGNILSGLTLSNGNSLVLKNPNEEISDKLGFGNSQDYEAVPAQNPLAGQSIGRKVLADNTEQDTDNNQIDFELQTPTPGLKNITYLFTQIGSGGGGSKPVIYPKILISEIKIAEKTGDKNIFVELYNPNPADVDLTDWYIFRNNSSFVTKTMFEGKRIPANGYFLLTKEGSTWDSQSDLLFQGTLNDNDKIALKNPNGDVANQASWSQIKENLSLGRKWDSIINSYADTDDNSVDFETDILTPKLQNIIYAAPPEPTLSNIAIITPAAKLNYFVGDVLDISGLVVIGTYSDKSMQIEIITPEDITGFDSSVPAAEQILTINFNGQTANFSINITEKILQKNILINEIQVGGQTAKDEFVELYNPNNFDTDLLGFSLKKETSGSAESCLVSSGAFSGIIRALKYFLIVPHVKDDETEYYTGSAIPDLHYSGKDYSVTPNNTILLYDKSGKLLDKVGFGPVPDFEGMGSAPSPDSGKSISRVNGIDTNDNSKDFTILDTPTPGG